MAVFAYKGRSAHGELVQGTLEGADTGVIASQLFNIGITPIEIELTQRVAEPTAKSSSRLNFRIGDKVGPMELVLFSRQMYTLLKAGVPIMRALAGLQESTQNAALSAVLQDLREALDSGLELSIAMRRHPKVFSAFYVSMVQIGEMTGMLDETFQRLFTYIEIDKQMRDDIRAAVRYPIFVVIAMAIAITIVNMFVIPAFAKTFASLHTELPLITRILIGFSGFMVKYWMLILVGLAGAAMGFRWYTNTPGGRYKWDKYKFKIPIAGKIIYKGTLARFARSLALAFKSGIPLVQGLNVVGMVVDNQYMRARVEQMRDGVERGESISRTATASGVFNPVVLQMIAVGEETGELDSLMLEIAGMYEREVEYDIKNLSAQIEPIMITALGAMVLVLALGIFLPMWSLGQAALHK
jgi:MSHA biogenesis protein MshG